VPEVVLVLGQAEPVEAGQVIKFASAQLSILTALLPDVISTEY